MHPGYARTPLTTAGYDSEAGRLAWVLERIPIGRVGQANDIAVAVTERNFAGGQPLHLAGRGLDLLLLGENGSAGVHDLLFAFEQQVNGLFPSPSSSPSLPIRPHARISNTKQVASAINGRRR